jgi:hypothetical protein
MFKKFRPKLSIILPIVILIILAFTYRNVLRSMVLVPLAYLIFIVRLIAGSIGQQTLWISFVVFSSIIAIISLAIRNEEQPEEAPIEHKYSTRLQVWLHSVGRKERSKYFQWNLAQDLSKLMIEAIAYRQGISHRQVVRRLEAGELDLPANITAYLQISQKPFMHTGLAKYDNGNWFSRIWAAISRQIPIEKYTTQTPLDLEPEVIIHFLENYLELDSEIWSG